MYPIVLELGRITIYSLWTFTAIGFLASLITLNKLIQKDRNKLKFIAEHSLLFFLGGLIFARLVFIIKNFEFYFIPFSINRIFELFYIWDKGLFFWGGILGITLTLLYFCHKEKEEKWRYLDILTICILTGLIFGNIGTFLDGSNYGKETNLPWGVIINSSRYAIPIHPTQIYSAIYTLLLTIILFYLYSEKIGQKSGNIALIGIGSYSILRFLEEFLRGDESFYFLGLREAQIYCIIALIISCIFLYKRYKNKDLIL